MKVIIVGAGIGGLLTAALLSRKGHDVTVLEKAPRIGGRFNNLEYRGFTLSTGAFHMIPHGEDGPFAHLLRLAGSKVRIVNSSPKGMIRYGRKTFNYKDGWKYLGIREKARALKLLMDIRRGKIELEDPSMSGREWIRERIGDNEFVDLFIKSYLGWADSVEDVTAGELMMEIKATLIWGGPGLIGGGCGAVIKSLAGIISKSGGRIVTKEPVRKINIEKKSVVTENGEELHYDVLVSDVGIKETVELAGRENFDREYLRRIDKISPSEGIKYNVTMKGGPYIGNTVVFTLETEGISGYNEPTALSRNLAPKGYSLLMFHQAVKGENIKREIERGKRDVHEIIEELGGKGEILLTQIYQDGNPVNRVRSGEAIPEFPVKDVYIVGDSHRPPGGIEVEGIALGVMEVLEEMGIGNFSGWRLQ